LISISSFDEVMSEAPTATAIVMISGNVVGSCFMHAAA